jgi:hypothetical protein
MEKKLKSNITQVDIAYYDRCFVILNEIARIPKCLGDIVNLM